MLRPGRARTSPRPGLDRVGIGYGGLLHLTGYPDRPPVRVGVTISDYLTGVFAAQAATARAVRTRRARRRQGAVIDAALYGAALRILEWTLAGVRPARRRARAARATAWRTRRRSTTTRPPTASTCASSPAATPTSPACARRWTGPTSLDDPRFATLADRAAHGDEINGIVADWTATLAAAEIEDALRRARRAGRDRVHRGRHLRRPAHRRPAATSSPSTTRSSGRCASRRRSPAFVGRAAAARRPARRASASTRARCSASSASTDAELDRPARARASCDATPADPRRACSTWTTTARSHLVGGCSPPSGRHHFPRSPTCPYSRRRRRRAGRCSRDRDALGLDRGHRGAAGLRRRRCRSASASSSCREGLRVITRLTEPDPARLDVRHADAAASSTRCTRTTTAPTIVTWAFAPA